VLTFLTVRAVAGARVAGRFEFGDALLGNGQLILQIEDPGGTVQRDALVDQLA